MSEAIADTSESRRKRATTKIAAATGSGPIDLPTGVIQGLIVPGLPHPLLVPEQNEGWTRIRRAFEAARARMLSLRPDLILIYSTMWPSVIGHQIQADPRPKWVHVDELFHSLGSIPYEFEVDAPFAKTYLETARARGLHARTIAYHGFPIDTGSVVALKLLTPNNEVPACIVSSNVYSDRAETIVLGKAAADAIEQQGKRAVAVVVTSLSNRLFTDWIDPKDDHIHSPKDDEWNRKMLEFLADGRLEDVAQLSREIHKQVRVKKVVNFKPMWWLSAVMGQHNNYDGHVFDYAPIYGAGGAVVSLTPSASGVGDKEYDEEDVDTYGGERTVLDAGTPATAPAPVPPKKAPKKAAPTKKAPVRRVGGAGAVETKTAPDPVGAYPHARREGDLLYLSGIGPRTPGTDEIPGGPVRTKKGKSKKYDVEAQTRQCIENIRAVLEASGSALEEVVDVTVFLIDMDRDFETFNRVYAEYFGTIRPTRTTVAVSALPTPIAVELKCVARAPR